jgi:hypothetical protein
MMQFEKCSTSSAMHLDHRGLTRNSYCGETPERCRVLHAIAMLKILVKFGGGKGRERHSHESQRLLPFRLWWFSPYMFTKLHEHIRRSSEGDEHQL